MSLPRVLMTAGCVKRKSADRDGGKRERGRWDRPRPRQALACLLALGDDLVGGAGLVLGREDDRHLVTQLQVAELGLLAGELDLDVVGGLERPVLVAGLGDGQLLLAVVVALEGAAGQ